VSQFICGELQSETAIAWSGCTAVHCSVLQCVVAVCSRGGQGRKKVVEREGEQEKEREGERGGEAERE